MKKLECIWLKFIGVAFISAISLTGCIKSEVPPTPEEWLEQQLAKVDKTKLASDILVINDSLALWELTPVVLTEPNGVRYVIEEEGTGVMPTLSSVITVKYKAKFLTNGEVFDESDNLIYPLYNLILGWQTTLPLLSVGTKATLYIPSGLAYGPAGVINSNTGQVLIPPNANLIFEIELVEVAN